MDGITIVTGGAGFIGHHLVQALHRRGHQLRILERPGVSVTHIQDLAEVVYADIRDEAEVRNAMRGAGFVFHLAANPNLWTLDRHEFDRVNHAGTRHVLDAAIQAGASRILHCSTESILTSSRTNTPIHEDVEIQESDAVGPYCLSKLRAEKLAMNLARQGAPVYVANPSMPVGPGDRGISPPTRLILDFASGQLPAVMDCTLNLVDVRDVAEGLVRVLEKGQPGRRYLLTGENLTLLELLREVSRLMGQQVPRFHVPYNLALLFAHISEFWADYGSGKSPQATITGVRLARRLMHFDPTRSREELDFFPRPWTVSIYDTLQWLLDSGHLKSTQPGNNPPTLTCARSGSTKVDA